MGSPYNSKKFRALFDEWNKKLAASGFKDAEDMSLFVPALKETAKHGFENITPDIFKLNMNYYSRASSLLYTYKFTSSIHRRVWQYYCEGHTIRKIAELVNEKNVKKSTVFNIIKKIAKEAL